MNLSSHTHRCLVLAEKLLANQNFEACLDVCNEIELLIKEMKTEGIEIKMEEVHLQKIKKIRVRLNGIIAEKFRQKMSNQSLKTNIS